MKIGKPSYYDSFRCTAGECHDTCCAAWDIVIDEKSATFYRSLKGELGERIRRAMTLDEDGDLCFSVSGGHCPLLTKEKLCAIQLELGEERVCDTCRSHPRFIEEYGAFRELSLAASCPAAIALILQEDFSIVTEVSDEEDVVCDDVNEPLLQALIPCREVALALLERKDLPWNVRLANLLRLGTQLQFTLLTEGADALSSVAEQFKPEHILLPSMDEQAVQKTKKRCIEVMTELEILDETWEQEIKAALQSQGNCVPQSILEDWERRWVCYLLWRWFLRGDFDGDIYGKVALSVFSILTLRQLYDLGGDWMEWARRWAKEVEHCAENLYALYDALCSDDLISPEKLIGALG